MSVKTPENGSVDGRYYDLVSDFVYGAARDRTSRRAESGTAGWLSLPERVIGISGHPDLCAGALRQQRESWRLSLILAIGTGLVVNELPDRVPSIHDRSEMFSPVFSRHRFFGFPRCLRLLFGHPPIGDGTLLQRARSGISCLSH